MREYESLTSVGEIGASNPAGFYDNAYPLYIPGAPGISEFRPPQCTGEAHAMGWRVGAEFTMMEKAIKAYVNRGPNLRHGIALDNQVTIILSQTDHDRPLCGIYFNLHSPYQKKPASKTAKSAS